MVSFVHRLFFKNNREKLDDTSNFEKSENFIEDGLLDSFDIVQLVSDIETEFNVVISALEILPENFDSIDSICNLINKSKKK